MLLDTDAGLRGAGRVSPPRRPGDDDRYEDDCDDEVAGAIAA
jgi:hypothetical protein